MNGIALLPPLLSGALITVELTIVSTVFGAILAFAAGIARGTGGRVLRMAAAVYIEIFRGTSLLVQLFWLYYALPLIGPTLSPFVTGVLALSLNIGAYGAEVVRGAVLAVPQGQREAAAALNFSGWQTVWRIVLPQALPEMMPPLGNLAVQNLKDTSLVSMITITDLTFHAQNLRNLTLETLPVYSLTLVIYFGMALVLMAALRGVEMWIRVRGGASLVWP